MRRSSRNKDAASAEVGENVSDSPKAVVGDESISKEARSSEQSSSSNIALEIQLQEAMKTIQALQKKLEQKGSKSKTVTNGRNSKAANPQNVGRGRPRKKPVGGLSDRNHSVRNKKELTTTNAEVEPSTSIAAADVVDRSQPQTQDEITNKDIVIGDDKDVVIGDDKASADEDQNQPIMETAEQMEVDTDAAGPSGELTTSAAVEVETPNSPAEELQASKKKSPPLYKCPFCYLIYADNTLLIQHLPSHGEEYSTLTPAPKNADDDHSPDQPVPISSSGVGYMKPRPCIVCGKILSAKQAMDVHMRIHTGEKPFQCQFCSREFRHLGNRGTHIKRVHKRLHGRKSKKSSSRKKVKPIIKPSRKSSRKDHNNDLLEMKKKASPVDHTAQARKRAPRISGKVACRVCRKSMYPSQLTMHMRIHTGERPYPCPFCTQKFRQLYNLQNHMQKVHRKTREDVKAETKSMRYNATSSQEIGQSPTEPILQRQLQPCKVVLTRCDPLILPQAHKSPEKITDDIIQSQVIGGKRKAGVEAMMKISLLQNEEDEDTAVTVATGHNTHSQIPGGRKRRKSGLEAMKKICQLQNEEDVDGTVTPERKTHPQIEEGEKRKARVEAMMKITLLNEEDEDVTVAAEHNTHSQIIGGRKRRKSGLEAMKKMSQLQNEEDEETAVTVTPERKTHSQLGAKRKAGSKAIKTISLLQNKEDEDVTIETITEDVNPSNPASQPPSPSSSPPNSQSVSVVPLPKVGTEEEESFKCSKCLKSFKRLESLINHLRRHLRDEGQGFKCVQCNKVFASKVDLKAHMAQHSSEKLKCQHCPKTFTTQARRSNHIVKKHLPASTRVSISTNTE